MLIEKIKSDMIAAKKEGYKSKASILSTLYAEAVAVGKNNGNRQTTDAEVITVIKKFLKGIEETFDALGIPKGATSLPVEAQAAGHEMLILAEYLPKQLVREELEDIIGAQHRAGKNMGEIMKHLKENYAGLYDGKMASEIAKSLQ